jgi:hypothetical protein
MNERDDLQELWQSQQTDVPRFAVLPDQTVPVVYPLSTGMKLASLPSLLYPAWISWRQIGPELPVWMIVTYYVAIAAGVIGSIVMLTYRQRAEPPPEASVADYRKALAREMNRQTSAFLTRVLPFAAVAWTGVLLKEAGRFSWWSLLVAAGFLLVVIWNQRRVTRMTVRRILSGS